MPGMFAVSGSPVTTSGTLTASLAPQSGNSVLASPADGSSSAPSFRPLTAADVPSLDAGKIGSGTLGVARGGTGATAAFAQGSVVFAGTGGAYTQSGSLVWDNANGRLGVGTGSPGASLSVYGAVAGQDAAYVNAALNGTGRGLVVNTQTRTSAEAATQALQVVDRAGGTALGVTVGGNVGIGVAGPGSKLEVNGAVSIGSKFNGDTGGYHMNTGSGGGSVVRVLSATPDGNQAVNGHIQYSWFDSPSFLGKLYLGHDGYSNKAQVLTVAGDGTVGIGTTSPQQKLHVSFTSPLNAGTEQIGQLVTTQFGDSAGSVANAGGRLGTVYNLGDGGFGNQKSAAMYAVSEDSLGYSRQVGLAFYTSPFDADRAERMRVDSSGNVGIGTTAPGAKLDVNGTVRASGFTIPGVSVTGGKIPLVSTFSDISAVTVGAGATVQISSLRAAPVWNPDGTYASTEKSYILRVTVSGDADITQLAAVDLQEYSIGGGNWPTTISNWTLRGRNWGGNYQDLNISPKISGSYGYTAQRLYNRSSKTIVVYGVGYVIYAP